MIFSASFIGLIIDKMTTNKTYNYELIAREGNEFSDYNDENSDCGSDGVMDLSNDGSVHEFLEEEEEKPQWYHHIPSTDDDEYLSGTTTFTRTIAVPHPFGGLRGEKPVFSQMCLTALRNIELEEGRAKSLAKIEKETLARKEEYAKKEAMRVPVTTPTIAKTKKRVAKKNTPTAEEVLHAVRVKKDEEKKKVARALKRRSRKDNLAQETSVVSPTVEGVYFVPPVDEPIVGEDGVVETAEVDEYVPLPLPKTEMVFNTPKITIIKAKTPAADWTVVGSKSKKEKAKPFIPLVTEAPNIVRGTLFTMVSMAVRKQANFVAPVISASTSEAATKVRGFIPKKCSFEKCGKVSRGSNGKYTNKAQSCVCFYLHSAESLENYYERTEGLCRYGCKCGKIKCLPNQTYWNKSKDDVCRLLHPSERVVNLEMRLMMATPARACGFGEKCFKAVKVSEGIYHSANGHVCKFLHPSETNMSFYARVGTH